MEKVSLRGTGTTGRRLGGEKSECYKCSALVGPVYLENSGHTKKTASGELDILGKIPRR